MDDSVLHLQNAQAAPVADVPLIEFDDFRDVVIDEVRAGARLSALFGQLATNDKLRLLAVLADDEAGGLLVLSTEVGPLAPNQATVSLIEGWRGEICHVVLTDERGRFTSYKVVDPSFHNWFGLACALRNQAVSDFPLCNKSFNLSYCGHDL